MVDDKFEYSGSYQDILEDFFTAPTKDNFPDIIRVDKEYDALEFKEEWHEKSTLAKHILSFANGGGGVIVYGVEEKDDGYVSTGLEDPVDEVKFGDKVEKYIPDNAHPLYALETFRYGDVYDDAISGKTFQVVFVDGAGEAAPLVCTNAGDNIDDASIYIRRSTKSERANYQEVQSLLRKRRESGVEKSTAELHEELRELKTLYGEIDKNVSYHVGLESAVASLSEAVNIESKPNPNYPNEDYEEYIRALIGKKKKKRIERRIGVEGIRL